jgi:hypothetical protein
MQKKREEFDFFLDGNLVGFVGCAACTEPKLDSGKTIIGTQTFLARQLREE